MKKQLSSLVLSLLVASQVFAQTLENYVKNQNSLVPVSPEAAQIMKYIDYPVNNFTGTANVEIPLSIIKGKGIQVPVSLSYQAGGGCKVDELANEVGLGWSMATGEITREVRGGPDEGGSNVVGIFNNTHNMNYYFNLSVNNPGSVEFEAAAKGELDLEPDLFYFRFGDRSGKFLYDNNLQKFECTVQQSLKINFNGSSMASSFTITTEDGTIYTFSDNVKSSSRSECVGLPLSTNFSSPVITSWKLSKITNPDRTDSIMFAYGPGEYQFYSAGSSARYQLLQYSQSMPSVPRNDLNCYTYNNISGSLYLNKIVSSQDSMEVGHTVLRQDIAPTAYAISDIKFYDKSGNVKNIFQLEYDYFLRNTFVGYPPEQIYNRKSLRLLSVKDFGNSQSNANPLHWRFNYDSGSLPGRLSYAQDFWGYANSNNYMQSLVPPMFLTSSYPPILLEGANRAPDPTRMTAGLLNEIIFPTGGSTKFEYEPNTTASPPPQASAATVNRQYLINEFAGPGQYFNTNVSSYNVTFVVNQGPDPVVNFNNPQGGVIANIFVSPGFPSSGPNPSIDPTKIHFQLQGPSGDLFQQNRNNVWLQNGTYTLKVINVAFMNQDQPNDGIDFDAIRNFNFTVTFKELAPGVHFYNCGGARVKSVTTKDNFTGNTMFREYKYHDPVTDSSYGYYIGSSVSTYEDYVHSVNGQSDFSLSTYLVRMGNCVMPGNNIAGSAVVYPKVFEHVREGVKKYTTEYTYNISRPSYDNSLPFTPPMDYEAIRGKLSRTAAFQDQGSNNFIQVTGQSFTYDQMPVSQISNNNFVKWIRGIKCSASGYSVNAPQINSFIFPPVSKDYINVTSRVYLIADTATEYFPDGGKYGKWNSYSYGDYNQLPLETKSGNNSDGSVTVQKNWFAADQPEASSEINATVATQMVTANRINQPLGTKIYKDNQLLSQQFTYSHFAGSKLLTDSMRQAIFSNPLEAEIKVLAYDDAANPLSILLRGNKYRKYIWNKQQGLALATCVMPQDGAFFFTSFEPGEYPAGTNAAHFSGSYAYQLNSANTIALNGFNSSTGLEVYAWTSGGGFTANSTSAVNTGITSGTWTLYKATLGAVTAVTISGNAMIDQLAVLPTGSSFEGNVYDGANRIVSKVTNDMQTTFFEYDNFGRLTIVRDMKGNIIKSSSYQYQAAQ